MTLFYLDSSVIIYLVERHPVYSQPIERTLLQVEGVPATSALTRLEVLVKPLQNAAHDLVDLYRQFLGTTRLLPIDDATFGLALDLRVSYRLKTPDALHLAIAQQHGCDEFWTNDTRLAAAADALSIRVLPVTAG